VVSLRTAQCNELWYKILNHLYYTHLICGLYVSSIFKEQFNDFEVVVVYSKHDSCEALLGVREKKERARKGRSGKIRCDGIRCDEVR
jgi:hypothetical protein